MSEEIRDGGYGKHRCAITCMEPGCTNKIYYNYGEQEVPMYCPIHRTAEGRHSATKNPMPPSPSTRNKFW